MSNEFDYPRDFKGVFIKKEIWLDKSLTAIDKVIFAEIDSLDVGDGCYASNEYLAEFCQCSITKVSTSISKLTQKGYLYVSKNDGRKRFLKTRLSKNERQTNKKRKADSQKVKQSNIDDNTTDNIVDNIDINAFSEDKSSSKDGIYASKQVESQTKKPNRYIPQDYSYSQLKEHIRPVYSNWLKSEYAINDSDTPIESILNITIEFYKMYERETGEKHPVLSDMAYKNIVDNFMNPPDVMNDEGCLFDGNEGCLFSEECYMAMSEQYFKTEYNRRGKYKGEIQKSFSHFMSSVVRENLFYRTCY